MLCFFAQLKGRDVSSRESWAEESGLQAPWGSLRPHCTERRRLGMFPPAQLSLVVPGALSSQCPKQSSGRAGVLHRPQVRKTWGICMTHLIAGYFSSQMCLTYQPGLIPATWTALQCTFHLIISAISFLLLSVLSEKTNYHSWFPTVREWTCLHQYLHWAGGADPLWKTYSCYKNV